MVPLYDRDLVNARRFLSQLFHVEFLGISNLETFFEQLNLIVEAIQNDGGPCCTFKNLKTLFIDDTLYRECDLVVLLAILQDFPSLNKLQIEFQIGLPCQGILKEFPSSDRPWHEVPILWNESDPLRGGEAMEFRNKIRLIHELKEIELFYYQGRKVDEELVKGLLQYATNLEKLVLYPNQSGHHILKNENRLVVPEDHTRRTKKKVVYASYSFPSC